jgi:gamma-D-glutamyl-L-lysine dipeptidyl-peptidase
MYFHCTVPVAPVRSEPLHRSEMVTQLLFGEAVELVETAAGGWAKVTSNYDGYIGWITQSHISTIPTVQPLPYTLASQYINTVKVNGQPMQVPYGSHIPTDALALNTSRLTWDFSPALTAVQHPAAFGEVVPIAHLYLNTPYLWGGKTVWGTDCSGLVQQVYKWVGLHLPRDAWQQAEKGTPLDFLLQAQPGDLAFFDNAEGRIIHTGILLNSHTILHASGKVRIDSIDTEGIVNSDTGARTHHLRTIKRMVP